MGSFLSIVHPKASTLSGLFSMVSAIEVNYEVVGSEKEDALDVDGALIISPQEVERRLSLMVAPMMN